MPLFRLILASVALLGALALPAGCEAKPPYERARATVYRIETGISQCTATAVGPNLMLGAEHCGITGPGRVLLNGEPVDVEEAVLDGRDHVLFRVSIRFKVWAKINDAPLRRGDPVFLIGHPEGLHDILRLGYFAGQEGMQSPEATAPGPTLLYDFEGGHGDSGAAIFDAQGRIVSVLTGGYTPTDAFRLIRGMPIKFRPHHWIEVSE